MSTPSELIRRAEECRRMRRIHQNMQEQTIQEEGFPARPMPTRHASYTRLMQNHDRIRTRHLSKSGN